MRGRELVPRLEQRHGHDVGGPSGTATRASSRTPARSSADRVKLTITRSHASGPRRAWISAIARNVARTSRVAGDGRWPGGGRELRSRRPPAPRSAGAPPSMPGGIRTSRPATAGVAARPTPAGKRRRHRATVAARPGRAGRPPVLRRRRASRPGRGEAVRGEPEPRRCGASESLRASSLATSGSSRGVAGQNPAERGAGRDVFARRPTGSARSSGSPLPARAGRGRFGSPWPPWSPRRSPTGCHRGRRRPTCPIAGTARTTAARAPQPCGIEPPVHLAVERRKVVKIVSSNSASMARTSSRGSGRWRRMGSVRHRPGDLLAHPALHLTSSDAPGGRSSHRASRLAIRHRCSTTARRLASVGWAVSTGVMRMSTNGAGRRPPARRSSPSPACPPGCGRAGRGRARVPRPG